MNDPTSDAVNDKELREVLARATDHVHSSDLAVTAWASAQRRRRGRRAGLAGAAAALVLVGGVVALQVSDRDARVGPAETPSQVPTTNADADLTELPTPPAVDPGVIQPLWDPATVDSLPAGHRGLPADLRPPPSGRGLTGIPSARAAVLRDGLVFLVDQEGVWYVTKLIEDQSPDVDYALALSREGTVVSVTGRTGLLSLDVRSGRWRRAPYPQGFQVGAGYGVELTAQVAEMAWLEDGRRRWEVDVQTGKADEIRVPDHVHDVALSYETVVALGSHDGPSGTRTIEHGGTVYDTSYFHSLTGLATDGASMAAMRGVTSWTRPRDGFDLNGLLALDLDDLSTRAYLPVKDPNYAYSDAGLLQAKAWLDDDTVLASVVSGTAGHTSGDRTLFTWDVETGDLRKVTSLPAALSYDVALDLLEE